MATPCDAVKPRQCPARGPATPRSWHTRGAVVRAAVQTRQRRGTALGSLAAPTAATMSESAATSGAMAYTTVPVALSPGGLGSSGLAHGLDATILSLTPCFHLLSSRHHP